MLVQAKVTKKITLRLTCTECKSTWQRCIGRTKTFTLGDAPGKVGKNEALQY